MCCCPFHDEKTPSCKINDDLGSYYCFGCGAKGDIFTIYTELYNFSFPEAVKELAQRVGIRIVDNFDSNINKKNNKIYKILEISTKWFQDNLEVNKDCQRYLNKRNLSDETIKFFKLGYSSNSKQTLYQFLKEQGFEDKELLESNVVKLDKNNKIRDFFYNRLMFPITNEYGKIVGFDNGNPIIKCGEGSLVLISIKPKLKLKIGDYILAGKQSGKVKAMFDERGNNTKSTLPSTPISILGLDGAPQAGDTFNVLEDEREAKLIATKRTQLVREQNVRTQRHITLDEIGRRIALGEFKELNIILKGDVDGSIEALSDSLEKLSTDEIKVNIIQKAVGQISDSDVMLAAASDAIIIGFQVRPSLQARKLSETEQIDIKLNSKFIA